MATDPWTAGMLLAAFAGGAFGAAVGALPSFVLAGLVVVLGEVYRIGLRAAGVVPPIDITGTVGFGVVLGPHVAFGGGAAALAYAVRRGYVEAGFESRAARDVTRGLGCRPDVLAVGGLFGVAGHAVASLSRAVAVPADPVALGVVASAFLHRAAFGYSLVGDAAGGRFDMGPYERWRDGGADDDAAADAASGPDAVADGGGPAVEPWLPHQYRWRDVIGVGAAVGVLGAYVAYLTGSPFLAFGISVVALAFLTADVAAIPVTHHVSLPASTAVLALAGAPPGGLAPAAVADAVALPEALLVGGLFGVAGALLGEALQRALYAHAETHLDPPAASIVVTSALIAALALAGVLPSAAWVPAP
ncbi:MAG: hypothetical protein ABEH40_03860 [Haloferacaceae archaeon]